VAAPWKPRSGEVRGLRVRDLDLDARVVHVRQAVVRLKGQLLIGPPKTNAGIRSVAMPPHLVPALRAGGRSAAHPRPRSTCRHADAPHHPAPLGPGQFRIELEVLSLALGGSVAAVPEIIEWYAPDGYQFVDLTGGSIGD
jgi:integrase